MADIYSGGYIRPITAPKRPRLATALAGAASLPGGGPDVFGLTKPRGINVGGLFPENPRRYTPPKPRPTVATPQPRQTPEAPPAASTAFDPGTRPGGAALYSLETDPALAQVYAYAGRVDSEARAQALRDKTQAVERAGLPDVATSLGLGQDVAQVAQTNPFSSRANLEHDYALAGEQLTKQNQVNRKNFIEDANQQNLFYSGYKDTELGRLADAFKTAQTENTHSYQGGLSGLAAQLQDVLAQINAAESGALRQNQDQRLAAESAARDRQIQMALAGGYSFGGFDAQGNPILLPPGGTSAGGGGAAPAADTTAPGGPAATQRLGPVGSTIGMNQEAASRYRRAQLARRFL